MGDFSNNCKAETEGMKTTADIAIKHIKRARKNATTFSTQKTQN
jgi:hypothetical protein